MDGMVDDRAKATMVGYLEAMIADTSRLAGRGSPDMQVAMKVVAGSLGAMIAAIKQCSTYDGMRREVIAIHVDMVNRLKRIVIDTGDLEILEIAARFYDIGNRMGI